VSLTLELSGAGGVRLERIVRAHLRKANPLVPDKDVAGKSETPPTALKNCHCFYTRALNVNVRVMAEMHAETFVYGLNVQISARHIEAYASSLGNNPTWNCIWCEQCNFVKLIHRPVAAKTKKRFNLAYAKAQQHLWESG